MSNLIITISREFGSGGRKVGELLSQKLGIPFYDKEIIQIAADKSGLSEEFLANAEDHTNRSFLFSIATAPYSDFKYPYQYDTPVTDKAFFAQANVIRELAAETSCVIVGRCADYILKDEEQLLRVFISADMEERRQRIISEYGIDEKESVTKLRKADKAREKYVRHYTGEDWGSIKNHDLVINTSFTGIDGAVEIIMAALHAKGYIK